VDLIEVAPAAVLDEGGFFEELAQQDRAAWAVDPSEARDPATVRKGHNLRLAQDATGGGERLGGAGFDDPGPVVLRVNGGAADEEDAGGIEAGDGVLKALEINLAVDCLAALAGADGADESIRALQCRYGGKARGIRDIAGDAAEVLPREPGGG